MTLDDIKTALLACFSGTVFTGPDTLFGSGTLKTVFDHNLPDGKLAIDGALSETSTSVVITGQGKGVFAGMSVVADFSPSGETDVLLVAIGTSDGSWSIASAFPALASSILADLAVPSGATLTLRTIGDATHSAGLDFQGGVTVGGPLGQAAQFIGGLPSLNFGGPVAFSFGAPTFVLTAPVTSKFSLGPLSDLGITMGLNAVAAAPADPTATTYGANGSIFASTAVAVTVNGQSANLPAKVTFGGGALVNLSVGAGAGSGVTIGDLLTFALGGDLSSLMPPTSLYNLADSIQLDTIDFSIAPLTPALISVTFNLSATSNWSIGSKFTVAGVTAQLYIPAADSSKLTGTISGELQIGENGSICTLDAVATLPQGTFSAVMDPNSAAPNLSDLITYVAGDFGLPAILVTNFKIALTPATSDYSLTAGFSTDWSLTIGDFGLSVSGASIELDYANGAPSGSVAGTLVLNQDNQFDLSYAIPGGFKLFAQVPSISLSALVGALCKAVGAAPPGFDFSFTDATILITKDGEQFVFKFGAQLESYGSASVVVQHGSGGWGFAFGVLLDTAKLANLPGLGLLSLFDDAFGLEQVVVVFGTLAQSTFSFPALSDFDNPSIKAPAISSPGWDGTLVAGLNIYAMLDPADSEALGWLCKLVGFDGTVAASLQVPEDPTNGTTFAATLSGPVNSNMTLSGAFVAKLLGETLELGLRGTIPTSIAGHQVTFTIEVDFEANGVFVSGSTPDTIDFGVVELGGLAIELGVDDEGIPSIGVAATIQVGTFDSSIAIFFDSANPAQSLFSGSISDVTLDTVMGPIIGVTSLPAEIDAILKQVSLSGTTKFTLPATLAASLDARDKAAVIAAFAAAGTPINSDPKAVSILGASSQGAWAVTDLSTLTHYHLSQSGNDLIAAEKEAQVKFVPQTTQIGSLPPVTGPVYAMSGALSVFGLTGTVDIDVEPSTGISIEASLSPVHFLNDQLLVITDAADDGKGPFLSLCTYQKDGKAPHATASGKVELLGLVGESVSIDISPSGATFALSSQAPVYSYSINVTLNSSGFAANGSAQVGFNQTLDLGLLGSLPLDLTIGGTIAVSLNGSAANASFSGNFSFEGTGFSVGPVTLDVTAASLEDLASEIASAVADAIKNFLLGDLDPTKWLNWVKNNIIPGMLNAADKVGAALGSAYHQTADQIAATTKDVLGYGADAAAAALEAANFTADAAATALAGAGFAADQIASALKSVFTAHADTTVHIDTPGGPHADTTPHLDTPGGPHADTQLPPHADTAPHLDTPAGPHADSQVPPHADTAPHLDTPAGPHADSQVPPHVDTSAHFDTPQGPHIDAGIHGDRSLGFLGHFDESTGHSDFAVPPHGDTSPHVDTPAGPHADSQVPPHVDTSQHVDTPAGPHADSQVPPHVDTSQHVDTPAGPHTDGPVPPHVDQAAPHVDSQVPPHIDASQHIDVQP